jgi:RecA/RadA recombinase
VKRKAPKFSSFFFFVLLFFVTTPPPHPEKRKEKKKKKKKEKEMMFDETALDLFERCNREPLKFSGGGLLDKLFPRGLRAGNGIQFIGPSSSGKSELLMEIASSCVLSSSYHGAECGGKELDVIYFDNDRRFDILRFSMNLERKIKSATAEIPGVDASEILRDSLQRLHVIRCESSFSLLCTLKTLPTLLEKSKSDLRVIIVDSIGSFFWLDKQEDEVAKVRQRRIVAELENLITQFKGILVLSQPVLFKKERNEDLLSCWSDLCQFKFATYCEIPPSHEPIFHLKSLSTPSPHLFTFHIDDFGIKD